MKHFLAFLALFILNISVSHSAVVIDIIETGGNVQATLSGNINLSAVGAAISTVNSVDGYSASIGSVGFTNGATTFYQLDVGAWTPFGTGNGNWDTSSGDAYTMFGDPVLAVPIGYVSLASLTATATELSSTFASVGLDPGTYVTTLTNGSTSDTVTINIGGVIIAAPPSGPATPIPTISVWGLGILIALMGLIGFNRRRKM